MLELGITFSFEQMVMDNDIIKMVRKVLKGIEISDETLAVDVIDQVGAGGDFLSQEHTIKYMRTEQSRPKILDRQMRYAWKDKGSKDLTAVAHEEAVSLLQNHKPEPLTESVQAELQSIIAEAEAEFAAQMKKK
ncbi:trimethylamine methyltransferase [Candidatus Formimonas warabiya]|uniref:Trimethylamine methyltransferase n=1 Tax=Formimonas warabiya TaxID=1761012 RepID=A0A3G1L2G8_FORW1|nr:trimethylamine methyltransferase [Candidatus Formimonas warabiya]